MYKSDQKTFDDVAEQIVMLAKVAVRWVFSAASLEWREKLAISYHSLRYVYAVWRDRDYLTRKIFGQTMHLPLKRPGITFQLAIDGKRELLETEIFQREVRPGMTIFDLGANIGYYTLMAATGVGPQGKIYAVEPFPASFETLCRNVESNGLSDIVECRQLAISSGSGTGRLYMGVADNVHTMDSVIAEAAAATPDQDYIEVATTSVADYQEGRRPFDMLRMDVQGGELDVFLGMEPLFEKGYFPAIMFEIHPIGDIDPDPRFTPPLERLLEVGYRPKYMVSSMNVRALDAYAELGYRPEKVRPNGRGLFTEISAGDLIKLAARRPTVTRCIYLEHRHDGA